MLFRSDMLLCGFKYSDQLLLLVAIVDREVGSPSTIGRAVLELPSVVPVSIPLQPVFEVELPLIGFDFWASLDALVSGSSASLDGIWSL